MYLHLLFQSSAVKHNQTLNVVGGWALVHNLAHSRDHSVTSYYKLVTPRSQLLRRTWVDPGAIWNMTHNIP